MRLSLGCCLPHGCEDIDQLLSLLLGPDVCPHPFLDEFQGPLVLRDLEPLHGSLLIGDKGTHLSDHVPHELGVLGEVPTVAGVPRLAYVLCQFVAQLRPMAMGQRTAMAAVPQWRLQRQG